MIGEILAGVLVGPTLFGGLIARTLFPVEVRPLLGALADVAVALFMFLVGLELDRRVFRHRGGVIASLTVGSVAVPFGLGVLLALCLSRSHPTPDPVVFVLFVGTAMAVTAFPVLARIVVDQGMDRSRIGGLALALAGVGDVLAWSTLALLVASAGSQGHPWRLLLVVPYVAAMVTVVPRALRRWTARSGPRPALVIPVLAGSLLAGGLTEWLGLHFIFGTFLFGVVLPRAGTEAFRAEVDRRVGHLARQLMPVYFVVAGLQVDLAGLGTSGFVELGLIVLVAMGGKFVGVYTAARLHRFDAPSSAVLATLMNVRGLTEVVLLTVGLTTKIIDAQLYSLMLVMAVLTTRHVGAAADAGAGPGLVVRGG